MYRQKLSEADVPGAADCDKHLTQLIQSDLVAVGIGENGGDALSDLLSNLYIIPVTASLREKCAVFLKMVFVDGIPLGAATALFRQKRLTDYEQRVINLARQASLSTAELIACAEPEVYDISTDTLYSNEYTTCDTRAADTRTFREQRPVLTAIANLYLRRQIIFERY
jgi:hypothetical protein